jgi:HD-GYP domain-containing protein (c-di-GMP phosphodiesterase class II)
LSAALRKRRMTYARAHEEKISAAELAGLVETASGRATETMERVLVAAREMLDMEVAFVAEFADEQMVFRAFGGDAESFGWSEGAGLPLEGTYCRRLAEGRLPNVVPDARGDERVKNLDMTREADIGAYVCVPLRFSDGRLYGTMCALSHSPDPSLRERDAWFMRALGRLVVEQLEREELGVRSRNLAIEATGVGALLAALEARDGYTGEHSAAVVELSVAVACRLGLPEDEIADVEQAALLHDVGKMGVPDAVLNKPGPLGDREWAMMREHPMIGERIVSSVEGLAHLAPIIRAEHERWDGEGYPDGLRGEEIPLTSRIVFACDAWHAMISDRPYREALGREALDELQKNTGKQFDPRVVLALLDVVKVRHLLPPDETERLISAALFRA